MAKRLLYPDTNILIYLLERHEPHSTKVAEALEEYTAADGMLVTSTITITEFLASTLSSNLATLRRVPKLNFVTFDEALAEKAALLQCKTRLQIGVRFILQLQSNCRLSTSLVTISNLRKLPKPIFL